MPPSGRHGLRETAKVKEIGRDETKLQPDWLKGLAEKPSGQVGVAGSGLSLVLRALSLQLCPSRPPPGAVPRRLSHLPGKTEALVLTSSGRFGPLALCPAPVTKALEMEYLVTWPGPHTYLGGAGH